MVVPAAITVSWWLLQAPCRAAAGSTAETLAALVALAYQQCGDTSLGAGGGRGVMFGVRKEQMNK